ncbi:hypothetical protein NCCP2222_36250 [Sporosarcina sp. NCCP-2222]|nr:hypothetical protein NCCP2222_36250 [Sporosarcina sp. NCCP-2222]
MHLVLQGLQGLLDRLDHLVIPEGHLVRKVPPVLKAFLGYKASLDP